MEVKGRGVSGVSFGILAGRRINPVVRERMEDVPVKKYKSERSCSEILPDPIVLAQVQSLCSGGGETESVEIVANELSLVRPTPGNDKLLIRDDATGEPIGVVCLTSKTVQLYSRFALEDNLLADCFTFLSDYVFPEESSWFPMLGLWEMNCQPVEQGGYGWTAEETGEEFIRVLYTTFWG